MTAANEPAMLHAELPACVSELAWYVTSRNRPWEMLGQAKALRRGVDEWVVWDGGNPAFFLHAAGDCWTWERPRRHYDTGWEGMDPRRYTLAEASALVPGIMLHEATAPGGQFAHLDLIVVEGFLPEREP